MPSSHMYQLNEITELMVAANPDSILDVGPGFGKYGFLAREYLELWDGREKYDDWRKRIDAVEVYKKYLTPVHDYVYNHIYVGDARTVLPKIKDSYDLILLVDILEHFERDDAFKVLEECRRIGRNLIISAPKDNGEQDENSFSNPHEAHKFQWTRKDFDVLDNKLFIPNVHSTICFTGKDYGNVKRALRKAKINLIRRRVPALDKAIIKVKSGRQKNSKK